MLIGHLPLGYIVGSTVRRRYRTAPAVVALALIGSIAPDVDMLRFYLIDFRAYNHRYYFTHWPLFWLATAAVLLPLVYRARRDWYPAAAAFFLGVASHLVVDTIQGPVRWLAPFSRQATELVRLPAAYSHWTLNVVGHWTFVLEIAVCLTAFWVWWQDRAEARIASSEGAAR